jgi:uncharacterized lipoprotein YddW (UPF0748 family)
VLVAALSMRVPAQEIRAFWADAFSPALKSREEVHELIRRLHTANCNAVFVQVRKGGDAYYQSRYEPWAADNPERFDGLGYLIERAHEARPRIAVHAWINTCAVGRSHGNPRHVAVSHPEWLSISDKGADYDGEATKIDPGHPDAADHTFRIYLDVLRNYDVDGIHLDFVRYGGTEWGYNPVSVARFNARYHRTGLPKPNDPLWMQWRRDQVTALVRKVYSMAVAVRPRAVISAATITWGKGPADMQEWQTKSAAMTRVFQDWRAWMEEGILDLNCLMSYYREARHAEWYRLWLDWAKDHQYGRWAVPASGVWLNPIADSLRQIEAIRRPSKRGNRAHGVLLYCYSSTNAGPDGSEQRFNEEFYRALAQSGPYGSAPFATPVVEPAMPWKTHPTRAHLRGFVLDANTLAPVDGALVQLVGQSGRAQRTDGTGYYAFVDVPPGAWTVTVSGAGYTPRRTSLKAGPGATPMATFFLGEPATPFAPDLEAIRSMRDGAPVRLKRAVVVGGTDRFPGMLFLVDQPSSAAMRVRLESDAQPPIQPGDVVAVTGVAGTLDGERILNRARVVLVDMQSAASETGTARWTCPGINTASAGIKLATGIVRVRGLVTGGDGASIQVGGPVPVEVQLAGRKGCGVEDEVTPLPAPLPASQVAITGLVTVAQRDGHPVIRLWPRAPEDIVVEAGPGAAIGRALGGMLAPPLAMVIAYTVFRRRNERFDRH